MAITSLLGIAQKAGRLVAGGDAVIRAMAAGRVCLLVLAQDASKRLARKVTQVAAEEDVPIRRWGTKAQLGAAVGKRDLGVLAVCDVGFAGAIQRELNRVAGPVRQPFMK